jgi:uncharacterized membrane protein
MTEPSFIQKEQDEFKWLDWLPLLFIAAGFAMTIFYYPSLPEKIPTHFNGRGEPDDWSGKHTLFMLPVITAVLYGMITLVIRYVPLKYWNMPVKITPENTAVQYDLARNLVRMLNVIVSAGFCYIIYGTIQVALRKADTLSNMFLFFFLGAIGLLIVGYFIRAMKLK